MHRIFLYIIITILTWSCSSSVTQQHFVEQDIVNFWEAYDKAQSTTDSTTQATYFRELFWDKASVGQQAMFAARNYSLGEYVSIVNKYPHFWASIRPLTLNTSQYTDQITKGIEELKSIYPQMRPAKIYYTMGAFRSPGTTLDSMVLIGSEFALANNEVNTTEFNEGRMLGLKDYYKTNPVENIVFLNVHEYVHTQQKEMVHNLLSLSLYEGIAEFVAEKALKVSTPFDMVAYGKANTERVKAAFEHDMFMSWRVSNWLWNDTNNQFGTRDLSYYIGYAMAEIYYDKATSKNQAIAYLIDLDYTNEEEIESFVDGTAFFSAPLAQLYEEYQASRPTVVGIKEFENESQTVDPSIETITLEFSTEMDKRFKSTDFGQLGKEAFPKVDSIVIAENGLSVTYHVELVPNQNYQILLEAGYRTVKDEPLKPYLVSFKTK